MLPALLLPCTVLPACLRRLIILTLAEVSTEWNSLDSLPADPL